MKSIEIDFMSSDDLTFTGEEITCHSKEAYPFYVRYYSSVKIDGKVSDYSLHVHPYGELLLFLNSNMVMNINGNIYNAKLGDVMLTRAGEPHFCTPMHEGDVEYLQIDIPDCAFDGVSHSEIFRNCFNNRAFCEDNILSPTGHDYDMIMKIARRIIAFLNTGKRNQMLIYSQFIQLMSTINDIFENKSAFSPDKPLPESVFEAVRYIHANLDTVGSLQEIANHLNVTVPYLSRTFKAGMNCTPHDYIVMQRIERAKKLMCVKDRNVYEACFESGFNDYSSFINIFRKKVGMTPLVYKKQFS